MEQETEKPFGAIHIVVMSMLVVPAELYRLFSDLIFAIPILGQILWVLGLIYSFVVAVIIIFWFVMKLGIFGGAGLALTVGGLLDMFGIPVGLGAGTAIAVYLANNPKVAAIASVATMNVGSAAEGAAANVAKEAATVEKAAAAGEGALAAEKGAMAAEGAVAKEAGAVEGAAAKEAAGAEGAAAEGSGAKTGADRSLGEPEEPMQKVQRELTEETPKPEPAPEPEEPSSLKDRAKEKLEDLANRQQNNTQSPQGGGEQEEDGEEEPMRLAM